MLDRLVRRAVLAQPDAVMRHHIDSADLLQRRQADRRATIVGENEEGAAIGITPPCSAIPFIAADMPNSRMP